MATTVVSIGPASAQATPASKQIDRFGRSGQRGFAILLVSAMTLFSVAIGGYHPYADDGGLYMAGVKRLIDPALYPHETAFVLSPTRFSIFAPVVAAIVRATHMTPDSQLHTVLPIVLFGLHLASIWATLFAAWMLATRCWTSREARTGAVALLGCWLGLPVAGTALLLMDPYMTARSFSTPCMIFALVGAIDMTAPDTRYAHRLRGSIVWALSIALAATMHPLMAAHAFGATLMLICLRSSRPRVRIGGVAILALCALALAALLDRTAKPESAAYIAIAMTRTYWYLAQWHWYELVGLAAPLAILALLARGRRRPQARALAQMAVAAGAIAIIVTLIFARAGEATHLVARMQPLRIFQIVYLVMTLALGAQLGERILRRSLWRWGAAILLLGGIMLFPPRAAFPASNHLELPGLAVRSTWVQSFLWIRANTPKDALFALDADYINATGEDAQCFRAIAERSSLPDYSKDGGEASIAPELTNAWTIGQAAQRGLSSPDTTDHDRLAALAPLGVDWVVLESAAHTNFECPYSNAAAKVCRLPKGTPAIE